MKKITFLLLVLTMVFTSAAFDCGIKELDKNRPKDDKNAAFYNWLPVEVPNMEKFHVYKTPKGANVSTQDPIPAAIQAEQFASIDAGIDRSLASVEGRGYTDYRKHSDMNIILIRPNYTSVVDGAGLIKAKPQFGDITACGYTVGLEQNPWINQPVIFMAQNWDSKYLQLLRNCTRHENEHLQSINDPAIYREFQLSDVHPKNTMADDNEWYSSPVK